jgi:hypothetical protein
VGSCWYLLDVLFGLLATAVPGSRGHFARVASISWIGFGKSAKCRLARLASVRIQVGSVVGEFDRAAFVMNVCSMKEFAGELCKAAPIDVTLQQPQILRIHNFLCKDFGRLERCARCDTEISVS